MPVPQVKKNNVLVICGPTATGKTKLAVSLIKSLFKSGGGYFADIISVDSRQVFRKMDIGTGKDLPADARLIYPDDCLRRKGIGYYLIDGVCVWGYDLVNPEEEFSVSSYVSKVEIIVEFILGKNRIPVLVGGSGLYLKSLVDGIETINIPKNYRLREFLNTLSVKELFEKLAQIDPQKAASLNLSDRHNAHRLIRAIEISQWQIENSKMRKSKHGVFLQDTNFLFIGLFSDKEKLACLIKKRVLSRWQSGFKDEVLGLLKLGVSWSCQSMTSMGYRNIKEFLEGRKSEQEFLSEWIRDEVSYAKRQMTWFNRDKRINWFDISNDSCFTEIENMVQKWYYAS